MNSSPPQKKKSQISLSSMGLLYFAMFSISVMVNQQSRLFLYPSINESFWTHMAEDALIAIAISMVVVAASWGLNRFVPSVRRLSKSFARLFGALTLGECFMIAIFSAMGEEFFFRGMLQSWIGLGPASILFGLLHSGPGRKYLPWTLFAVVMGFVLGAVYEWRSNLLLPVAIHFLVNFVNLVAIGFLLPKRNQESLL
ncbi:MAG: CPBP family intramembrane glutamic endopeptidase [Bdellovibrionota bacterium]